MAKGFHELLDFGTAMWDEHISLLASLRRDAAAASIISYVKLAHGRLAPPITIKVISQSTSVD